MITDMFNFSQNINSYFFLVLVRNSIKVCLKSNKCLKLLNHVTFVVFVFSDLSKWNSIVIQSIYPVGIGNIGITQLSGAYCFSPKLLRVFPQVNVLIVSFIDSETVSACYVFRHRAEDMQRTNPLSIIWYYYWSRLKSTTFPRKKTHYINNSYNNDKITPRSDTVFANNASHTTREALLWLRI